MMNFSSLCDQVRYEQRTLSNQVCNFSCNHGIYLVGNKKCTIFYVPFSTSSSATICLCLSRSRRLFWIYIKPPNVVEKFGTRQILAILFNKLIRLGPAYNGQKDAKETSRYKWVLIVTKLLNMVVNDFDAKQSAHYSRVLVLT